MGDFQTPQRRYGEALMIEHFNASADDGTVYGRPTAATDGIEVPHAPQFDRVSLEAIKSAASGNRTLQLMVYGYRRYRCSQTSNVNAERASSSYWTEVYDTGALDGGAADWNKSWNLEDLHQFDRLAVRIVTNGGTTPLLTAGFAFHKERRNN